MKKLLGVVLALACLLGLAACAASYNGEFTAAWFVGRWVQNGDPEGLVYVIHKDGYTLLKGGKQVTTGTWVLEERLVDQLNGGQIKTLCAVLTPADGRSGHGGVLRPDDSGHALYQFSGNTYYIREGVIGKKEGRVLSNRYRMVCGKWFDSSSMTSALYFDIDGSVTRRRFDMLGASETVRVGSWTVDEKKLSVTTNDGVTAVYGIDAPAVVIDGVTYSLRAKE